MKKWIAYLGMLISPMALPALANGVNEINAAADHAHQADAPPPASEDLSEISLEKLMDIQVTGTSKYTQNASDAPADITIIRADEIKAYGWQTLADLLNSVRGFNVSSDFVYHYAGIRGFAPPGDYNNRLLVLINGHRLNDNLYDQAYIGTEFPIDVSLIRKVEISRGPSSTLYGGNALFGIVNIITKKGESLNGNEVSVKAGSGRYGSLGVTHGSKLSNGADLLLSTSWAEAQGRSYSFPEFIPTAGTGFSGKTDYRKNNRVFASYNDRGLSLMAFASERTKGNPGAMWGGILGDPTNQVRDRQAHLEGTYTWDIAKNTTASSKFFLDHSSYMAISAYDGPPVYNNYDEGIGTWWGTEFKVDWKAHAHHRVIAGAEYQRNTRQEQINHDTVTNFYDNRSSYRAGLYIQDNWRALDALNLVYGLRFDRADDGSAHTSPRLAAIWKRDATLTGKLMYGTAFRAANMYEQYYAFPGQYVAASRLQAETIRTLEAQLEKKTADGSKITGSLFSYAMNHQIVLESPAALAGQLQYTNTPGTIRGKGAEIEFEKKWDNLLHVRSSFARYFSHDSAGNALLNAPSWMLKANAILPPVSRWVAATELNTLSRLKTNNGSIGSQTFVNLNLTHALTERADFSFLIHNLLNRDLRVPVGDDALGLGFVRDTFPAQKRGYLARLTIRL